jgi:hypothetical protein
VRGGAGRGSRVRILLDRVEVKQGYLKVIEDSTHHIHGLVHESKSPRFGLGIPTGHALS